MLALLGHYSICSYFKYRQMYLNWIMALYTKHFRKMLKHFKMGGAPLHNIEGMGAAFLHKVGGSTNTIAKGVQIAKRTM